MVSAQQYQQYQRIYTSLKSTLSAQQFHHDNAGLSSFV